MNAHELVADKLIKALEAGTIPWQSPSLATVGWPRNYQSRKRYQGVNILLLACEQYQSPYFLTYLQAKELGGHVRKGEHGHLVMKVGTYERKGAQPRDDGTTPQATYLKAYSVFNACQIDGIDFPTVKAPEFTETEQSSRAKEIIQGMKNPPQYMEGRHAVPCYFQDNDTVSLPSRETFREEWRFYKTYFHELAHSTGHASRLNRPSLTENRGMHFTAAEVYSLEELTAEIAAATLSTHAGMLKDDGANTAAYIQAWLEVLKSGDNAQWLHKAASAAQKAVDYILPPPPFED